MTNDQKEPKAPETAEEVKTSDAPKEEPKKEEPKKKEKARFQRV